MAIKPFVPLYCRPQDLYTSHRELAAAQTFNRGALVLIDSNNEIAEAGTNPTSIAGVATAGADRYDFTPDTFGNHSNTAPIALASQTFRGTFLGTFAAADVGGEFGVTLHSSGYWVVDKSKTGGTARVKVIAVDDGTEVGDVNPAVSFVILPANRQVVA